MSDITGKKFQVTLTVGHICEDWPDSCVIDGPFGICEIVSIKEVEKLIEQGTQTEMKI